MKKQFLRFIFFLSMCLILPLIATAEVVSIPEPVPPPPDVRDFFELDPFYEQWIDVEGFSCRGIGEGESIRPKGSCVADSTDDWASSGRATSLCAKKVAFFYNSP